MSQFSVNGNGNASISFPSFSELIEEYCDRVPKEPNKFFCPACHGHNLSFSKDGKFNCHNDPSPAHRQEIIAVLNEKYRSEYPELSGSKNGASHKNIRLTARKTERQVRESKRVEADFDAGMKISAIEEKVAELTWQFDPLIKRGTQAALQVEMAAWAKAHGHDIFSATRLLAESLKRATVEAALHQNSTPSNAGTEAVSATVASVELLLERELKDWQELEELTHLQALSGLTKDAFWSMVANLRMERNIKAHVSKKTGDRPVIDWSKVPVGLGAFVEQMKQDAGKRSIDPTAILWAALPAVMSVLPLSASLNMKGLPFPSVLWSALLMESGQGKSRAEDLIMEPLRSMQSQELKDYKDREKAHDRESKNSDDDIPDVVAQRKYMFNIATIASIMDALSKQTLAGSIWLRDEIAGIFKSLGQFSKGDNEEKEIFLALWDGKTAFTDRKSTGSSETANPRLSLFGGLQPGKFRQVFKDMDDVDGMAARVMLAYPEVVIDRHRQGEVKLPFLMRSIYERLGQLNMDVRPQDAAYELWNDAQTQARLNAERQSSGAIGAWMRKMPGHLGRMAFAIHALECGMNSSKQTQILTLETMRFAVELCRYSLESYRYMLQQGTDSQDVESVVSKILGKANQLGGLTAREAVQYIKPLTGLAKENKKTPTSMALDLFSVLVEEGKGSFIQSGKTKKFIPTLHLLPVKPQDDTGKSSTLTTDVKTLEYKDVECVEVDRSVASTVDEIPESTTEETKLEIGQTITITGGVHKGSYLVLEIGTLYNGETLMTLLNKDNYPLAMTLESLIQTGYIIEPS